MIAPRESKEGTHEGQVVRSEEFAKAKEAKRKKRLAVSIQKGKLLFLPTALEKPPAPPAEGTNSRDSGENG